MQGALLMLLGIALLGYGGFTLFRPRAYQRYLVRSYDKRKPWWPALHAWARGYVGSPRYLLQILICAPFVMAFGLGTLWAGGVLLGLW